MIQLTIEFTGLAKTIAGVPEITLSLPEGTTYRDVVRKLGELYPGLIGILIAEDGETFLSYRRRPGQPCDDHGPQPP